MGTTGVQLEKWMQKSRHKIPFLIRSKNLLKPADYKEPSYGIINMMDSTAGNGSHWVAYYIPPPSKKLNGLSTADKNYYFDSYGAPPPEEVITFLKTKNRKIVYNDQQLQKLNTDTCGEYCLHWLKTMLQYSTGKTDKLLEQKYLDFIYNTYDTKDLESNERLVKQKIKVR